jgi:hypothetical protein
MPDDYLRAIEALIAIALGCMRFRKSRGVCREVVYRFAPVRWQRPGLYSLLFEEIRRPSVS